MNAPRPALQVLAPRRAQDDQVARVRTLEVLSEVAARVASSLDLPETLQHVADAVVECLGFGAAVINLCQDDGVAVVTVRGPQDLGDTLLGTVHPYAVWADLLSRSDRRGGLCWIDGSSTPSVADVVVWVPDLPVTGDPARWHPLDMLFAPLRGASGELVGVLSVDLPDDGLRPRTEQLEMLERFGVQAALAIDRARMHSELAAQAELFTATFDNAPTGMVVLHTDGTVRQANRAALRFIGRPAVGRPCWELVDPRDADTARAAVEGVTRSGVEGRVRSADGRSVAKVAVAPLLDRTPPCLVVLLDDVTEQLAHEQALHQQATTDGLTGLANRQSIHARVERSAGQAHERPVAVLYCDLDDFKLVNDSFGHAAGDDVLVEVSRSLSDSLRDGDVAGRLGGDEFVVVLEGIDGPADAIALAERIGQRVRQRVDVRGCSVTPSLSIGIAFAEAATTADELLAQADAALYDAKAGGRGRWELYTPELRARALQKLQLREELISAVEREEFVLEYQPIIELATGLTHGYEALLRWQHPQRGLLQPDAFLATALAGELAAPITDWVFDRALGDAATWEGQYGVPPVVCVNVSPSQLQRSDLAERLGRLLVRHGLDADRLCVEVTEDAVVEGARELGTLTALRELGIGLAVDDFGSGYAGLLSLRDVPADVVKLDRAFTESMLTDPVSRHVVEVVVDLCARLGRDIVAEGIESPEQAEALRELGVRFGQGWQLGRPAPLTRPERRQEPDRSAGRVTPDLDGELRRLEAALAATSAPHQVGEVAVQAAERVVGCSGGSLVVLSPDGTDLLTSYAKGYPVEVVNRFLVFPVDAPLPLAKAVVTGAPVWLEAVEMVQALHEVVPVPQRRHVALAALPLVVDGTVVGAFGVSWTTPVLLEGALCRHLEAMADHVARHLCRVRVEP